jgi:aryl-alcohol dehydrogenase-like predicted oxidoreductase
MRKSNQTKLGKDVFEKLLRDSYERGINLFDCADLYGSHPFIAGAFKKLSREKYVVVTKIWVRPKGIPEKERHDADVIVRRFLKELNTDYIDLVCIHCMTDENWTDNQKKQMEILAGLKSKGLIRAHGVSIHSMPAMKAAIASDWVDSIHARVNPYKFRMDGEPKEVVPLIQKARKAGKGLIGMKLVGEGTFGTDKKKIDESIKLALNEAGIESMIVGFEKLEEIDDFAERVKKTVRAPVT